jgi:hypothetical protein
MVMGHRMSGAAAAGNSTTSGTMCEAALGIETTCSTPSGDVNDGTDVHVDVGNALRIERPEAKPGNPALVVRCTAAQNPRSAPRRHRRKVRAGLAKRLRIRPFTLQ